MKEATSQPAAIKELLGFFDSGATFSDITLNLQSENRALARDMSVIDDMVSDFLSDHGGPSYDTSVYDDAPKRVRFLLSLVQGNTVCKEATAPRVQNEPTTQARDTAAKSLVKSSDWGDAQTAYFRNLILRAEEIYYLTEDVKQAVLESMTDRFGDECVPKTKEHVRTKWRNVFDSGKWTDGMTEVIAQNPSITNAELARMPLSPTGKKMSAEWYKWNRPTA